MRKNPGNLILLSIAGIAACVVFTCAAMPTAVAESPIRLIINGKTLQTDVPPQMMEGRVMIPIHWVAEALGKQASVGRILLCGILYRVADAGNRKTAVEAVRLTEGTWRVIAVERGIPFSEYAGPGEEREAIR